MQWHTTPSRSGAIPGTDHRRVSAGRAWTGTPISFGHSSELTVLAENWLRNIGNNYGVMMKANRIAAIEIDQSGEVRPYGDQRVQFMPEAYLRLSFDQRVSNGP